MAKFTDNEIITRIEGILGSESRVEADLKDPELADIAAEVNKARIRLPLTNKGIAVDFGSGTSVSIYRIGAAVASSAPAPAEKESKKAVIKATPKRHQHTFSRPRMMSRMIDILADEASHIILMVGSTGTGKSVTIRGAAEELGLVLHQPNGRKGLTFEELVGSKTVKIDEATGQNHIVFEDGVLIQAMQEGLDEDGNEVGDAALLFVDEAGGYHPDALLGLNRMFESDDPRRTLVVTNDSGRVIRSHSKFRIVMASNTNLRGESGNPFATASASSFLHTGQMDAADVSTINRVTFVIPTGYDRGVEKRILQEKVGDDEIVKDILEFRDAIRDHIRAGKLSTPFGTRSLIKIADGYRIFKNIGEAVFYTVFGSLMPEEVSVYNETALAIFGKDLLATNMDADVDYL